MILTSFVNHPKKSIRGSVRELNFIRATVKRAEVLRAVVVSVAVMNVAVMKTVAVWPLLTTQVLWLYLLDVLIESSCHGTQYCKRH